MLVLRHTFEDGAFFDIAVPTCYFNYEQFVTAAHVDFEMKDVSELSAKLQPLHNMVLNQILATPFVTKIQELFGVNFELLSVDVGTIHRHPGGSARQSFSGTDLDANNTHHGIVFPLTSGTDKPSFSGILAVDGTECNVAHYEYRIVNGAYSTNDLSYTKGRCLALTLNDTFVPKPQTLIEKFFKLPEKPATIKVKEDNSIVPAETIYQLLDLIELLPSANTQLIRSENVKKKAVVYNSTYYKQNTQPYKLQFEIYDYPIHILKMNYNSHLAYNGLPEQKEDLTKDQLLVKMREIYNYVKPVETKPATPTPTGQFRYCKIMVKTEEELLAMTQSDLIKHHDELDFYYYGKQAASISQLEPGITTKELIDYILELYLSIMDEEQPDDANSLAWLADWREGE